VALRPTRGEGPPIIDPDHTEPIHLVNQRRRMWIMAGQIGKWLREVRSNDRHKLSASSPKLKYAAAQSDNEYDGFTGNPPYSILSYSAGLRRCAMELSLLLPAVTGCCAESL
jgi:hypothetical protein